MLLGPVPGRPGGLDPEETCALLERVLAQAGAGQGQEEDVADARHASSLQLWENVDGA